MRNSTKILLYHHLGLKQEIAEVDSEGHTAEEKARKEALINDLLYVNKQVRDLRNQRPKLDV